jgi:hypothetical protein
MLLVPRVLSLADAGREGEEERRDVEASRGERGVTVLDHFPNILRTNGVSAQPCD